MSRTVELNPLVVLVSVLVGVELFGILGALLAIPAAGVIQVIARDLCDERRGRFKDEPTIGTDEVPDRPQSAPRTSLHLDGASRSVEVEGHIIDSLILAKVLDVILDAGADYRIVDVEIGKTNTDPSRARHRGRGRRRRRCSSLLVELQMHGANRVAPDRRRAGRHRPRRRAPAGFYSTTNLPTAVRLDGHWVDVENPEMDCALVVRADGTVRTVPMHRVRAGDHIVVGTDGVRVRPLDRPRGASPFEFMTSEVSSEKPKALLVAQVADAHARGPGRRRQGPGRVRAGRRPHRRRPRRRPPGARRAGSTCSSPATASPPTTSSRTCWARRSACR